MPDQVAERFAWGKSLREKVPRKAHADWKPKRRDPVEVLEEDSKGRLKHLVPIRYGRMAASPFTFLRGSPVLMANDLARTPRSGATVQICGDAHLQNFGVYASPERSLLFDLNDFDETLPGPWEFDLKRLAASFVVAGRVNGFGERSCKDAALTAVRTYREWMHLFSEMRTLDVWYHRVAAEDALTILGATASQKVSAELERARKRDSLQALSRLTVAVRGARRIINDPPLLSRVDDPQVERELRAAFARYRDSLQEDRRALLDRFHIVDIAWKVVGVGSVGTRCWILLLESGSVHGEESPLFLQVKEARTSVHERNLPRSAWPNRGQRVVAGQRLLQAASDIFLGWSNGPLGVHCFWRQLRDQKGSAVIGTMSPSDLTAYASLCGAVLARAHARSGDPAVVAGYVGESDRMDKAVASFARDYADQVERDHEALRTAIKLGRVAAVQGV